MFDSCISLPELCPEQELDMEETLEPLIQNYYSLIYQVGLVFNQSLLQRESIFYADSAQPRVKISRFTFWQFSQLPKLVSDSLFAAKIAEIPGSFSHFIEIFKILEIGDLTEQCKLIFRMIDRDGDGYISYQECHAIFNHSIGNPAHFISQAIPANQQDIKNLLNMSFKSKIDKISEEQFQFLREKGINSINDKLLTFLQNHFRIKEKVKNYQITNPELSRFPISVQFIYSQHSKLVDQEEGIHSRRVSIREEEKEYMSTIESEYEGVLMEGSLYRMVGIGDLKRYYGRLINTQIYLYKNKLDD